MESKFFSLFLALGVTGAFSVTAQEKEIKLPPQATEFYEPVVQVVTPGSENHLPPAMLLYSSTGITWMPG